MCKQLYAVSLVTPYNANTVQVMPENFHHSPDDGQDECVKILY
jgi:hypothetical protein